MVSVDPILKNSSTTILNSLSKNQAKQNTLTNQLSTGKTVNSLIDNPSAYFQAQGLSNQAQSTSDANAQTGQAISALQVAQNGAEAIGQLNNQLQGITAAAQTTTDQSQLSSLATQFNQVAQQITNIAKDTSYQGQNLIGGTGNTLSVQTGTSSTNTVSVNSVDLTATGLGIPTNVTAANLGSSTYTNALTTALQTSEDTIRAQQENLGSSVATLQVKETYNTVNSQILQSGAEKLTQGNTNEVAAKLIATQTQNQLGLYALSLTGKSDQGLTKLLNG